MIYIYSHGRMANQYFEYAFARSLQQKIKSKYGVTHEIVINFGIEGDLLKHTNAKYLNANNKKPLKKQLVRANQLIAYTFFRKENKKYVYGKFINKILNTFGIFYNQVGYYDFKIYKRKNYVLDGYFQSERYFNNYKNIIIEDLKNKDYKLTPIDNSICLHIRRGDYLLKENDKFLVCDKKYYLNAIALIKRKIKNPKFYVFSDDIAWVKSNFELPKDTYFEDHKNNFYDNFSLMYNCKNFILSNSSYSWWAQYLASANIVIAPSIWNKETNNRDIYQKNWILIENK